jgi:hypothetical protein
MCVSYDPHLTRRCREDAEEFTDWERANSCGYFKARPGAYRIGGEAWTQAARAKLGDLFGAGDKTDQDLNLDREQDIFSEISGTYVSVAGIIPVGVG